MKATNEDIDRRTTLPAPRGDLANAILRAVIETGDHIGTAGYGGSYGFARSHFLLIELPEQMFNVLCQYQAGAEDAEDSDGLEDDGDGEPDHDNEPEGYAA